MAMYFHYIYKKNLPKISMCRLFRYNSMLIMPTLLTEIYLQSTYMLSQLPPVTVVVKYPPTSPPPPPGTIAAVDANYNNDN